jgi:hypothetical protein
VESNQDWRLELPLAGIWTLLKFCEKICGIGVETEQYNRTESLNIGLIL